MIQTRIDIANFTSKLREYVRLTGKGVAAAVKEQAALLAQALVKNTYPRSATEGKRAVERDVNRVFLRNSWFEEKFRFRNSKFGDRVKGLIAKKDAADLFAVFRNSARLSKIRIERFDRREHEKLRRKGRVLVPDPRHYAAKEQGKVRQYAKQKQRLVGTAKAGWAQAAAKLGRTQPAWLNKAGTGDIKDDTRNQKDPTITLINRVSYFRDLDARAQIVSRSLMGRAKAMISSAVKQLDEAARRAGFKQ